MRWITVLLVTAMLAGCAAEDPAQELTDVDSDGDGYLDEVETRFGSDPLDPESIPDLRVEEALTFQDTATIRLGTEVFSPVGPGCGAQGTFDVDELYWTIEAPENASEAKVSGLQFSISLPQTIPDADIDVYDPKGNMIGSNTDFNVLTGSSSTLAIEGDHDAGEYRIVIRGCNGSGDVDVTGLGVLSYVPEEGAVTVAAEPAA